MLHAAKKRISHATLGALALLLSSCIEVDDFGGYWNKGAVNACINAIVLTPIREEDGNDRAEAKSLKLAGATFVMLREKPEEAGGYLMRYAVIEGMYVTYRLNEKKREDFLKRYPNSPIRLTDETATIPKLNEETAAILADIVDEKDYWLEASREPFNPNKRSDCDGN